MSERPERPLSAITELTTPGSSQVHLPLDNASSSPPPPLYQPYAARARQSLEYGYESELEEASEDGHVPRLSQHAHIPHLDERGLLTTDDQHAQYLSPLSESRMGTPRARPLSGVSAASGETITPSRLDPVDLDGQSTDANDNQSHTSITPTPTPRRRPLPSPLKGLELGTPINSAPGSPSSLLFPQPGGLQPPPRPGMSPRRADFARAQMHPTGMAESSLPCVDAGDSGTIRTDADRPDVDTQSMISVSTAGMAGVGSGQGQYFSDVAGVTESQQNDQSHDPPNLTIAPRHDLPKPHLDPFIDRHHPTLHNIPVFPFALSPSGSPIPSPGPTPMSLPSSGANTPTGRSSPSKNQAIDTAGSSATASGFSASIASPATDGVNSLNESQILAVHRNPSKLLKLPKRSDSRPGSRPNSRPNSLHRIQLDDPQEASLVGQDAQTVPVTGDESSIPVQATERRPKSDDTKPRESNRLSFIQALSLRPALTSYNSEPPPKIQPLHRTASGANDALAALVESHGGIGATPTTPRGGLKREKSQNHHRVRKPSTQRDSRILAGGLFSLFSDGESDRGAVSPISPTSPMLLGDGASMGVVSALAKGETGKGDFIRDNGKDKDRKRRSKLSKRPPSRILSPEAMAASLALPTPPRTFHDGHTDGSIHDGSPEAIVRKSGTFGVRDNGSEMGQSDGSPVIGKAVPNVKVRGSDGMSGNLSLAMYAELKPINEAGVGRSDDVVVGRGGGGSGAGSGYFAARPERSEWKSDDTVGTVGTVRKVTSRSVLVLHNPSMITLDQEQERLQTDTDPRTPAAATPTATPTRSAPRPIPIPTHNQSNSTLSKYSVNSTSTSSIPLVSPASPLRRIPLPPTPPPQEAGTLSNLSAVTPPHLHSRPAAPVRRPTVVPVSPDPHARGVSECAPIELAPMLGRVGDAAGAEEQAGVGAREQNDERERERGLHGDGRSDGRGWENDDLVSTLAVVGSSDRVDVVVADGNAQGDRRGSAVNGEVTSWRQSIRVSSGLNSLAEVDRSLGDSSHVKDPIEPRAEIRTAISGPMTPPRPLPTPPPARSAGVTPITPAPHTNEPPRHVSNTSAGVDQVQPPTFPAAPVESNPPLRHTTNEIGQAAERGDIPLLVASHLLSTHAQALVRASNMSREAGDEIMRLAKESLDVGGMLMRMAEKERARERERERALEREGELERVGNGVGRAGLGKGKGKVENASLETTVTDGKESRSSPLNVPGNEGQSMTATDQIYDGLPRRDSPLHQSAAAARFHSNEGDGGDGGYRKDVEYSRPAKADTGHTNPDTEPWRTRRDRKAESLPPGWFRDAREMGEEGWERLREAEKVWRAGMDEQKDIFVASAPNESVNEIGEGGTVRGVGRAVNDSSGTGQRVASATATANMASTPRPRSSRFSMDSRLSRVLAPIDEQSRPDPVAGRSRRASMHGSTDVHTSSRIRSRLGLGAGMGAREGSDTSSTTNAGREGKGSRLTKLKKQPSLTPSTLKAGGLRFGRGREETEREVEAEVEGTRHASGTSGSGSGSGASDGSWVMADLNGDREREREREERRADKRGKGGEKGAVNGGQEGTSTGVGTVDKVRTRRWWSIRS